MTPSSQTPRELLNKFYKENNFGDDGGNSIPYVKIELTKNVSFYFPNFDQRRRAVLKHDIHHILTGYPTTMAGESEISAWELGSGCKKYWAAFFIDMSGMMLGLWFNLPNVFKAFARGRRTKNLYSDLMSDDEVLGTKISELQKILLLNNDNKPHKSTITDFTVFIFYIMFGGIYSLLSFILLPFIIGYSLYVMLKKL